MSICDSPDSTASSSAHPVSLNLKCLISRNYKDLLWVNKNNPPQLRPPTWTSLCAFLPLSVRDAFTVV